MGKDDQIPRLQGCDVGTPPDGFVFPMTCTIKSSDQVNCTTASFHVIANRSSVEAIVFDDPLPSGRFAVLPSETCREPSQMCKHNYDQKCGAENVGHGSGDGREYFVTHDEQCIDPTCQTNGCACGGAGAGTCECYWGSRYTVRAKGMVGAAAGETGIQDAKVCYTAKLFGGGEARRCVHFDVMVPPDQLFVSTSPSVADKTTRVDVVVGYELSLYVFSHDYNLHQSVAIDMRRVFGNHDIPTVELPNQRWDGLPICVNGAIGQQSANMTQICPGGLWRRTLKYTARHSEAGLSYDLYFQGTDSGLSQATLMGTLSTSESQPGGTCVDRTVMCSAAGQVITLDQRSIRVNVKQVEPVFVFEDNAGNKDIFSEQNREAYTPLLSTTIFLGTPEDEAKLPNAYVNCEIVPFGVFAYKPGAILDFELSDDGAEYGNALDYGLQRTDRFFYPRTYSQTDLNGDFYSYMGITWRPRQGSEGRTYRLCVRAFDAFSEARRCFTIDVVRCMYCTTTEDRESIQSVAARFSSNWLQVWAANGEWIRYEREAIEASGATPWVQTDNPNYIEQGALVKLGPVYTTRREHSLEDLATRFQTTAKSLLAANPDIRERGANAMLPAGQEVCVLPGICTASSA